MNLPNLQNISFLAFLAPLALFASQIRSFLASWAAFFVRSDSIKDGWHNNMLIAYLKENYKEIKFGNITYNSACDNIKKYNKTLFSLFEFRARYIFIYRHLPIFISKSGDDLKISYLNVYSIKPIIEAHLQNVHIQKVNFKETRFFTKEVSGRSNKEMAARVFTEVSSNKQAEVSGGCSGLPLAYVDFAYLAATPPVLYEVSDFGSEFNNRSKYFFSSQANNVLNEVESWAASKDWYLQREIRHFRGCILHGKPGTGKSALVYQIGKKLDIPIFKYNLSSMDDSEFLKFIQNEVTTDSILLFEDIDCIFKGRENILKSGLSFDTFINKLSGVNGLDGYFVFITTNHIENLDPALIRPGRIDSIIELSHLCKEGKKYIASRMLDLWPSSIEEVVNDDEETAAEFEARVSELAIKKFWEDSKRSK